jgi:hypothetical protein
LSSTQIGAIGENLLVNAVMKASDGRLSPFQPMADDDGLDVLFFDKETGHSVAIQLKCRTATLRRRGSEARGNIAHFQVRQATFNAARRAHLVAALFNEDLSRFLFTWFLPMEELPKLGRDISGKWVIRPSKAEASIDRFVPYRCATAEELATRIIAACSPYYSASTAKQTISNAANKSDDAHTT